MDLEAMSHKCLEELDYSENCAFNVFIQELATIGYNNLDFDISNQFNKFIQVNKIQ